MPINMLIVYDPKGPAIEALAAAAGKGATATGVAEVVLRRVQEATLEDLLAADALMLGSPNWSGVTGSLKLWLDETGDLWEDGSLAGKAAAALTTGWGRHSGIEMTLLQLIQWLLACGMIVVGLPWSDRMRTSASYYGATAIGGVTPEDLEQAEALGARLAMVAAKLQAP